MSPVRIGIVGCGAAAERYYVPAFKKHPQLLEHLCLVDKNIEQAKELAKSFGGGKVYDNHHDIIDFVDGVIIALPHSLHFPIAMDFMNAKIHVLCEKPLAETALQVREMIDSAKKNKVQLCVNNTRRMFPAFQTIRELIESGVIGNLKSIKYIEGNSFAWPSATGFYVDPSLTDKGVLLDLGPHVLDTICWWLGGNKPNIVSVQDDSFGGPESVMRLEAELNDCRIDITCNRLLELGNSYSIVGDKGSISGKIFDWCNFSLEIDGGEKELKYTKTDAKTYPDFVIPIIDNFIEVIQGTSEPLVPGREALSSIKLIEEAYAKRTRFSLPWYDNISIPELPDNGEILITGASGFIGCRIAELLHLGGKTNFKAAIHKWSSAARLGRFPVKIETMDLMDKGSIEKTLEGITYIIHCAKGPDGAIDQGTRNLLEISHKHKIKHFVHLSTTEVYGRVEGDVGEDSPFEYTGNEYNKSKIDAEKACWEYHEKGLPITVIRPSIVYGIFSNSWTIRFAKMMLERKWGLYQKYGEGLCNLIYVDDLVQILLNVLGNEKTFGNAFNAVGPEVISWNEYFNNFNNELGLEPLKTINASQANVKTTALIPVRFAGKIVKNHFMGPVKKMAATFSLADKILRATEKTLKETPVQDELELYGRKAKYSSTKLLSKIDYQATIKVNIGLSLSKDWLKHQGCLSQSKQ